MCNKRGHGGNRGKRGRGEFKDCGCGSIPKIFNKHIQCLSREVRLDCRPELAPDPNLVRKLEFSFHCPASISRICNLKIYHCSGDSWLTCSSGQRSERLQTEISVHTYLTLETLTSSFTQSHRFLVYINRSTRNAGRFRAIRCH